MSLTTDKIPPIDGMASLRALISLIRDVDDFEAKSAELEQKRLAANAAVELVGPAMEIADLRAATQAALAQAQDAAFSARRAADGLKADAGTIATRMKTEAEAALQDARTFREKAEVDAKATLEAARKKAAEAEAGLVRMTDEALDRMVSLDAREKDIAKRESDLQAAMDQAVEAKLNFEQRVAAINRAASGG